MAINNARLPRSDPFVSANGHLMPGAPPPPPPPLLTMDPVRSVPMDRQQPASAPWTSERRALPSAAEPPPRPPDSMPVPLRTRKRGPLPRRIQLVYRDLGPARPPAATPAPFMAAPQRAPARAGRFFTDAPPHSRGGPDTAPAEPVAARTRRTQFVQAGLLFLLIGSAYWAVAAWNQVNGARTGVVPAAGVTDAAHPAAPGGGGNPSTKPLAAAGPGTLTYGGVVAETSSSCRGGDVQASGSACHYAFTTAVRGAATFSLTWTGGPAEPVLYVTNSAGNTVRSGDLPLPSSKTFTIDLPPDTYSLYLWPGARGSTATFTGSVTHR